MNEHEFIARLDGAERVSITVHTDGRLQVAIAYEFGYRLDEIRGGGSRTLVFLRDDSEAARHRAAWAGHHHRTTPNGAWWNACWPPHVRSRPDAVTPAQAGAARIAVHHHDRDGTSGIRTLLLIAGTAALAGAGYAHHTHWLALTLLTLAILLLTLVPTAARLVRTAHHRQLALLRRFEAQRHPPPPDEPRTG
ncbi:hypothetical protein RM844_14175 [Streptomyces sp. DSM 44915]|uniref:Integral membrane protein n=1 Tax=Streptomyces chisholmiae TaxID=3075540 RepID=A0ABU2JR28_9ACTN|nr:hypothetical protein [Streptomyces sp. DSM 44915]MDT0267434.1 hypothetical protein [Streptomyces sp. DSM 44915]